MLQQWREIHELEGEEAQFTTLIGSLNVEDAKAIMLADTDQQAGQVLADLLRKYNLSFIPKEAGSAMGGDYALVASEDARFRAHDLRTLTDYLKEKESEYVQVLREDLTVQDIVRRVEEILTEKS